MSGVLRTCTLDEAAEFKLRVGWLKGKKTLWFRYAYDGMVYEIPRCLTTDVPNSFRAAFPEEGFTPDNWSEPVYQEPIKPKAETFGTGSWNLEDTWIGELRDRPEPPAPAPATVPPICDREFLMSRSWQKKWLGDSSDS
jgi:hypothetical protein